MDRKGITVPTTDLFIAAAAYKKATVLHLDSGFERIASVVDLKQEMLTVG